MVDISLRQTQLGLQVLLCLILTTQALEPCGESGSLGWRCKDDSRCITGDNLCDGESHCSDNSDEEEGCRLYPETGCKSWFGKRHIKCNSSSEEVICTLPHLMDKCRACPTLGFWRCNDGFCIKVTKVQNGLVDCYDGSDEWRAVSPWLPVVLAFVTVALVILVGLLASILFCKIYNGGSLYKLVWHPEERERVCI